MGSEMCIRDRKGGDFGGTWYWNRYPGASCDIESYVYFPLLEKTDFVPKQKYTNAPETLEYCGVIAEKYSLHENALLQTEVTATEWDEELGRWRVSTNRADNILAKYVVHSNGPLNRPKLPAIRGINDYKGHTFHTSRWDYAYTGGDSHGNLSGLTDKKVAIIGTGATAVQCVPHLGAAAKNFMSSKEHLPPLTFEIIKPLIRTGWRANRVVGRMSEERILSRLWLELR